MSEAVCEMGLRHCSLRERKQVGGEDDEKGAFQIGGQTLFGSFFFFSDYTEPDRDQTKGERKECFVFFDEMYASQTDERQKNWTTCKGGSGIVTDSICAGYYA